MKLRWLASLLLASLLTSLMVGGNGAAAVSFAEPCNANTIGLGYRTDCDCAGGSGGGPSTDANVGPVFATNCPCASVPDQTPPDSQDAALTWEDFVGKRFAVKAGSPYEDTIRKVFAPADVLELNDYPTVFESVKTGKADAALRSYATARMTTMDGPYAELAVLKLVGDQWELPFGAISMDQQLIAEFNQFVAELKDSGTYDDMVQRWLVDFKPTDEPRMPDIPLSGNNGTYVVGVSSDYVPLSFLGDNGVHVGFDIELATRFAAAQGKNVEFQDMTVSALLPYVQSGKADFGISDILITPERAQAVYFTEPYYIDSTGLVYRPNQSAADVGSHDSGTNGNGQGIDEAQGAATEVSGNWLQRGIQRNLIQDSRWKLVVSGLGVTLLIAIAAQVLGTVAGAGLCFLLLRRNRLAKGVGRAYCGLIHGTPIVVLLMIIYYVVFGSSTISNVLVAIVAFTFVTAAAVAQTLKTGIESVDPSEIEAARSLGYPATRAFLYITLPQAIRQAMPAYLTGFVELVKATAIVGYIAIMDLTRAGDLIRSRTYDAYFPLLLVALIYLLVTTLLVFLFKLVLRRLHVGAAVITDKPSLRPS